jgi:hypothetical protein
VLRFINEYIWRNKRKCKEVSFSFQNYLEEKDYKETFFKMLSNFQEKNIYLSKVRIFNTRGLTPADFKALSKLILILPKVKRLDIDGCTIEDKQEEVCLRSLEIALKRSNTF